MDKLNCYFLIKGKVDAIYSRNLNENGSIIYHFKEGESFGI